MVNPRAGVVPTWYCLSATQWKIQLWINHHKPLVGSTAASSSNMPGLSTTGSPKHFCRMESLFPWWAWTQFIDIPYTYLSDSKFANHKRVSRLDRAVRYIQYMVALPHVAFPGLIVLGTLELLRKLQKVFVRWPWQCQLDSAWSWIKRVTNTSSPCPTLLRVKSNVILW